MDDCELADAIESRRIANAVEDGGGSWRSNKAETAATCRVTGAEFVGRLS